MDATTGSTDSPTGGGNACSIGGVSYASGAVDPADECHACIPEVSTTAWTDEADGTTCSGGGQCCGGTCASTQTDPTQCGSCGNACPYGAHSVATCSMGACALTCSAGYANCDGDAANGCEIDTTSDPSSCGQCGSACPTNEACVHSQCVCPASDVICGGSGCVDVATDAGNCGTCGHSCGPGGSCAASQCVCNPGNVDCGGTTACVDLATDPGNCGACGHSCGTGNSCVGGQCVCGSNEVNCGATIGCVDLSSNPSNCGACGKSCGSAGSCVSGWCR